MRISINQPSYLGWLGYFELISSSDVFMFLDDVPFSHQSWRSRNRIRTTAPKGWSWLSVPVKNPHVVQNINLVEIDNGRHWAKKHIRTISQYYGKSEHFDEYFGPLKEILESPQSLLCELDIETTKYLLECLGIKTKIMRTSDLEASADKSEKLLALCESVGATEYYSPQLSKEYLDESIFAEKGIRVLYQDYNHPTYRQQLSPFVSHMSVIDLLFNEGSESYRILTSS